MLNYSFYPEENNVKKKGTALKKTKGSSRGDCVALVSINCYPSVDICHPPVLIGQKGIYLKKRTAFFPQG